MAVAFNKTQSKIWRKVNRPELLLAVSIVKNQLRTRFSNLSSEKYPILEINKGTFDLGMEVFEAVLVKGEAVLAGDSNELFLEFVVMLEKGGVAEAAVPVLLSVASAEERDLGEDFLLLLPLLPLLPPPLLLLPKLFSLLPTDPWLPLLPPNLFNLLLELLELRL